MQRTPSPPRRLHTPPAPLHGPAHDSYEPYSPRRSARLSAQRSLQSSFPTRSRSSRSARETTPTGPKSSKGARVSLQGLSPPSSPTSPVKHRSPRSSRRAHFVNESEDSDHHAAAPTPAPRLLSVPDSRSMLPTPAKTPRKRVIQTEESLSSTARVLFAASNQASSDEAHPTPSRRRKKYDNVFSLESFERAQQREEIPFYVDSRDRVPTGGDDEDNPFLSKNGNSKGKGKAKSTPNRKVDPEADQMEAAADREEGIVYMFRGKKVFRKFQDSPSDEAAGPPTFSDEEVRRQAGSVAHRPITRSSVKPRLLFKEEIKQRESARHQEDDEEAITDIEVPMPTPSGRKSRRISHEEHQDTTPASTTTTVTRSTRQISFDSWSRVKSVTRESRSSREPKKRAAEPLVGASEKRQKSESTPAMSAE
ncbi:uncharacterized protein EI97DRAFT_411385 [Westerdykella ornata]|uniref:Uncharacterized protein n=1 Tax=Westerdykella ornata TaxID=318751 RepID=A0A6A6JVX6_WESOR|nr:uncharacterized protein EI97DRAFT_411385 [Westerdykella ornata]KAF2280263.1 hypothetical protein EI97DRAFT_411385 [Westerdykella ornata]